ncbi:hypothetical protein KIN20_020067 [Parelaphostrongylus tenuis]|uniref:Uncharacterized protein n=1 Tax=Parelaphostrongylus tenuis TaxID=148309 RepID=A0AAD5QTB9_PARTN|nr:hypothetical protein KIN20_020067 [Parelaphostrongylus tenuis]
MSQPFRDNTNKTPVSAMRDLALRQTANSSAGRGQKFVPSQSSSSTQQSLYGAAGASNCNSKLKESKFDLMPFNGKLQHIAFERRVLIPFGFNA